METHFRTGSGHFLVLVCCELAVSLQLSSAERERYAGSVSGEFFVLLRVLLTRLFIRHSINRNISCLHHNSPRDLYIPRIIPVFFMRGGINVFGTLETETHPNSSSEMSEPYDTLTIFSILSFLGRGEDPSL